MSKSRRREAPPSPPPPLRPLDRALFRVMIYQKYGELTGVEAVRAAIADGADIHAVDPATGATPLFAALGWGGWVEGVAVLLELGADPDHRDARGRTADEEVTRGVSSALEAASAQRIRALLQAQRTRPGWRRGEIQAVDGREGQGVQ